MIAEKLTDAWVRRDLTEQAVRRYIEENLLPSTPNAILMSSELEHVANLCHRLYLWSIGKIPNLGHFLTTVVNNDLTGATHLADDVNRVNLWIYPAFIYNIAPGGWKKMMLEE